QISEHVLELLIAYKHEHPSWGPEKLVHNLKKAHAELSWPALSTAGEWLKRAGLVQKRRFLNRPPTGPIPLRAATEPNQTWAADFKGDFALQSGQRCF
ncbi:IS481 family transposase, partial [Pseudomonas frederiksbergensis]|nr:IS481 family transposase [Pseudomonas frederiksbergensis]